MIVDVYTAMLKAYPDVDIIFLGDSSGADLALIACHYNKTLENPMPMPKTLILVSPLMLVVDDPAMMAAMEEIAPYDNMGSIQLIHTIPELFNMEFTKDNFYLAPLFGDFTNFPPVYVFSGTHDAFYPQIPPFVDRLKSAGVTTTFIQGQDMMHNWPYMPLAPESKKTLQYIIKIIGDI
jgi:acetyl esterase/lipase